MSFVAAWLTIWEGIATNTEVGQETNFASSGVTMTKNNLFLFQIQISLLHSNYYNWALSYYTIQTVSIRNSKTQCAMIIINNNQLLGFLIEKGYQQAFV